MSKAVSVQALESRSRHNKITIKVAAPTPIASPAVSLYTRRTSHMTYEMTKIAAARKTLNGNVDMAAAII